MSAQIIKGAPIAAEIRAEPIAVFRSVLQSKLRVALGGGGFEFPGL